MNYGFCRENQIPLPQALSVQYCALPPKVSAEEIEPRLNRSTWPYSRLLGQVPPRRNLAVNGLLIPLASGREFRTKEAITD